MNMTNEEFIEFGKKQNRFRSIQAPTKPATKARNLGDGLREWIESKAGRPLPEKSTEDDEDFDFGTWWDKNCDEYAKNYDYEKEEQEIIDSWSREEMYDFGTGKTSNVKEMYDFYGSKIVSRIQREIRESCGMPDKERENGHISKELWKELRDIRAGKKPRSNLTSQKKSARKKSSDTQINDNKKPSKNPKEKNIGK